MPMFDKLADLFGDLNKNNLQAKILTQNGRSTLILLKLLKLLLMEHQLQTFNVCELVVMTGLWSATMGLIF